MTTRRIPIACPPSTYIGPFNEAGLMDWFDQVQRDRMRIFKTNIALAVDAGELTDDPNDVIDAVADMETEAREEFRRKIRAMLERYQKAKR